MHIQILTVVYIHKILQEWFVVNLALWQWLWPFVILSTAKVGHSKDHVNTPPTLHISLLARVLTSGQEC